MKLEIVNSGTKEFPFYQIMDGENEFCATDSPVNAEKIVKLCAISYVSQQSDLLKAFIRWNNKHNGIAQPVPEKMADNYLKSL